MNNLFQPNNRLTQALNNPLNYGFSCNFLQVEDSLDSIIHANGWIIKVCANSGAPSVDVSRLSPKDTKLSRGGVSSGIIPFIEAMDANARSAKRELNKNHAGLIGLDVSHPEIDAFLDVKLPMLSKVVYITDGVTLTQQMIEKLTNYYKKQPKLFFHKRKYDYKGVNLCTEIKDMESGDTCVLGSVNLCGYKSVTDFENNFHADLANSALKLIEIDKELKQRYRSKRDYYELVSLGSNNNQVGLSCLGLASLMGHFGVDYSNYVGSDLEATIKAAYHYAASVVKRTYPEYQRVFTQAPTVHSHLRFFDAIQNQKTGENLNVTRTIEPLQGYDYGHESGNKISVVISQTTGNTQYFYHPNTPTVQETSSEDYFNVAIAWQNMLDSTGLSQGISFSWFDTESDTENSFGVQDFKNWLDSPLPSLYYYVPIAKISDNIINDKFGGEVSDQNLPAAAFDKTFDEIFSDCECGG